MTTDPESLPGTSIDFGKYHEELTGIEDGPSRIINVPVWGWTGDGKTCAILAMLHHARASEHGLSLALVDDTSELETVTRDIDAYAGLGLVGAALATKARLTELWEAFADDCRWPPGTDEPTPYVLRIRRQRSTCGYLYLPDLTGGSYQRMDEVARGVLKGTHGRIMIIDPERFTAGTVISRQYEDALSFQVQQCVEQDVPAAYLIAKADLYGPEDSGPVDDTHNEVTLLTEGTAGRVFRVSVINDGVQSETDENGKAILPPVRNRQPSQLIEALVWLLTEALKRPLACIIHECRPESKRAWPQSSLTCWCLSQ